MSVSDKRLTPAQIRAFLDLRGRWIEVLDREDIPGIEGLIAQGMDPDAPLPLAIEKGQGLRSLAFACRRDRMKTIECLVAHGAPLKRRARHGNMLLHAGSARVVEYLVAKGLKPDQCTPNPIGAAMREGEEEVIVALVRHGADPNARNKHGANFLARAIQDQDPEMVRVLLAVGACPEQVVDTKNFQHGALHHAIIQGDLGCVQALLDVGCRRDARNEIGDPPLIAAVFCDDPDEDVPDPRMDMVRLLLAGGVDPHTKNIEGRDILAEAKRLPSSYSDPAIKLCMEIIRAHLGATQLDRHTSHPGAVAGRGMRL